MADTDTGTGNPAMIDFADCREYLEVPPDDMDLPKVPGRICTVLISRPWNG